MKGYYEATRKKPQTVGEFLKKTSERMNASAQIDKHNAKEGTAKLKMVTDTIHYQNSSGWTALNMLHDPIMEMNALEAIRMVTPARSHSIYPTLAQIYSVRRADERAILQNYENLNREVFLTPELKTQLLKYKKESVDMYENDRHWSSDENYDTVLDKENAEIQWLQMFRGAQNDFFNSQYVRGFGLVFQYNPPPDNQAQNQPLPLPQAPNHNPEQNPEEEAMLQELREQLAQILIQVRNQEGAMDQMAQENERVTQERDVALTANERVTQERDTEKIAKEEALRLVDERDQTIREKDITIAEQRTENEELNINLRTKYTEIDDLNLKLRDSEAKVAPLEEKVSDLKIQNGELKDDKKIMQKDKEVLQEEKKQLKLEKEKAIAEKDDMQQQFYEDIFYYNDKIEHLSGRIEHLVEHRTHYEVKMTGCENCIQYVYQDPS